MVACGSTFHTRRRALRKSLWPAHFIELIQPTSKGEQYHVMAFKWYVCSQKKREDQFNFTFFSFSSLWNKRRERKEKRRFKPTTTKKQKQFIQIIIMMMIIHLQVMEGSDQSCHCETNNMPLQRIDNCRLVRANLKSIVRTPTDKTAHTRNVRERDKIGK